VVAVAVVAVVVAVHHDFEIAWEKIKKFEKEINFETSRGFVLFCFYLFISLLCRDLTIHAF
jgi:hypothetical protein